MDAPQAAYAISAEYDESTDVDLEFEHPVVTCPKCGMQCDIFEAMGWTLGFNNGVLPTARFDHEARSVSCECGELRFWFWRHPDAG